MKAPKRVSANILDSSCGAKQLEIEDTVGGVGFHFQNHLFEKKRYYTNQITLLEEVDGGSYRSAGKAAAGAIVGGVLTGGAGLIAGAALGGRRRSKSTFLVVFDDGIHLSFEIADKDLLLKLKIVAAKRTG